MAKRKPKPKPIVPPPPKDPTKIPNPKNQKSSSLLAIDSDHSGSVHLSIPSSPAQIPASTTAPLGSKLSTSPKELDLNASPRPSNPEAEAQPSEAVAPTFPPKSLEVVPPEGGSISVGSSSMIPIAQSDDSSSDQVPLSVPMVARSNIAPSRPSRSWVQVVNDAPLIAEEGVPTTHASGAPLVHISDEEIESAKEEFKDCLVARFPKFAPEIGRVIGIINAVWARRGPRIFVHKMSEGTFLLRVPSHRTREILLSRSVWHLAGRQMLISKWAPTLDQENLTMTKARVLVEFRNLPFLLFNELSLRKIATAVGKPISIAPETARKENLEVAKILIEVDLREQLPSRVFSGFKNGSELEIEVKYPWLPPQCDLCNLFGHSGSSCPTKPFSADAGQRPGRSVRSDRSKSRSTSRSKSRKPHKKLNLVYHPKENKELKESGTAVIVDAAVEVEGKTDEKADDNSSKAEPQGSVGSSDYDQHVSESADSGQINTPPPLDKDQYEADFPSLEEGEFLPVDRRKVGRRATRETPLSTSDLPHEGDPFVYVSMGCYGRL